MVDRSLWVYSSLIFFTTALAWIVYLAAGRLELLRPLFASADRFRDLTNYVGKIAHLKDGGAALASGLPTYNYPAPAAWVYAFFLRGFPHHPAAAYITVLTTGLLCGAALLWIGAIRARVASLPFAVAILTTMMLGLPLIFTVDRGNLEGAVALVLGAGLVLFTFKRYGAAAVCIALAASIKPFPALFLFLLFRKGRYKEIALGVAAAICATVLALTALGPTPLAAYKGLQPGVKRYYDNYIMLVPDRRESRFNHSLMDSLKSVSFEAVQAYRARNQHVPTQQLPSSGLQPSGVVIPAQTPHPGRFRSLFRLAMALGAIGLLYTLARAFKMPTLNQMILIGVAVTLFPPVAAEYTLLHLYVPFGLFLLFLARDVSTGRAAFSARHTLLFVVLFALILSPMTFFERYSGDAQTLLLLALLLAAGTLPMQSSIFGEFDPPKVAEPAV